MRSRNGSVPGQAGNQWSAFDPVLDSRGSTQITVAPLLLGLDDPLSVGIEVVAGLEVGSR